MGKLSKIKYRLNYMPTIPTYSYRVGDMQKPKKNKQKKLITS